MATTPTSDPGSVAVPTAEQAKAEYNAALAATPPPVPPVVPPVEAPPQPLAVPEGQKYAMQENADGSVHLKLSTGEEFTGTPLEVSRQVAESKVTTTIYAKDLKTKLDAASQPATPVIPADPGESADVLAGREFLANETARYLGFKDAAEMKQAVSQMTSQTQSTAAERTAAIFHGQNPDFPATDAAAAALLETVQAHGLNPNNPDHLRMAHAESIRAGKYKPLTATELAASRGQTVPNSVPTPPPMVPTGAPQATGTEDEYTMPLEKLRKLAMGR